MLNFNDKRDNKFINEYIIRSNNVLYKFNIKKKLNKIIIKCNNEHLIKLSLEEIIKKTKIYFESIEESYIFILNLFIMNKVIVKESLNEKEIIISFQTFNNISNKEEEIILSLTNENTEKKINDIYYKYNLLKNDLSKLKEENTKSNKLIQLLFNEINNIKKENNLIKNQINSLINRKDSKLKDNCNKKEELNSNNSKSSPNLINSSITLIKDAYGYYEMDNIFIVFNSINNISHIIYVKDDNTIVSYNLNEQKVITEIKNAQERIITNFNHYLDKIKKRDLIMSISAEDCRIKLWNLKNWECILYLKDIYQNGCLFSACFINDKNNNYIAASNCADSSGFIKIYNFNGEKIKEIDNNKDETYFIDAYYENKKDKIYIITGNKGFVKSYDYYSNNLYKKYYDNDLNKTHDSAIVNENKDNNEIINLVDSCQNGFIGIWNFHLGILLHKINVGYNYLEGICLWNDNYLFVGGGDNSIKLIKIENETIIKSLTGHNENVLAIKKIEHYKYGESLISQGNDGTIRLWIYKT